METDAFNMLNLVN